MAAQQQETKDEQKTILELEEEAMRSDVDDACEMLLQAMSKPSQQKKTTIPTEESSSLLTKKTQGKLCALLRAAALGPSDGSAAWNILEEEPQLAECFETADALARAALIARRKGGHPGRWRSLVRTLNILCAARELGVHEAATLLGSNRESSTMSAQKRNQVFAMFTENEYARDEISRAEQAEFSGRACTPKIVILSIAASILLIINLYLFIANPFGRGPRVDFYNFF